MFIMRADTPEQTQKLIVEWLNRMAAIHGVNSRLAYGKTKQKDERLISDTYLKAGEFVGNMKIERIVKDD